MHKQIVIARKDLKMSAPKLAAQVSHGSLAFLTWMIRNNTQKIINKEGEHHYDTHFTPDNELYEKWINGSFTKVVLQAKNKNHLLKATELAKELGMKENVDYFLIKDDCRTELIPEEEDGRTLTCIGFTPMASEIIDKIGRKYHIYIG